MLSPSSYAFFIMPHIQYENRHYIRRQQETLEKKLWGFHSNESLSH